MHEYIKPSYKREPIVVVTHGLTAIIRCFTGDFFPKIISRPEYHKLIGAIEDQREVTVVFHIRKVLDSDNTAAFSWNPESFAITVTTKKGIRLVDEIASVEVDIPMKVDKEPDKEEPGVFIFDLSKYKGGYLYTIGATNVLSRLVIKPAESVVDPGNDRAQLGAEVIPELGPSVTANTLTA